MLEHENWQYYLHGIFSLLCNYKIEVIFFLKFELLLPLDDYAWSDQRVISIVLVPSFITFSA